MKPIAHIHFISRQGGKHLRSDIVVVFGQKCLNRAAYQLHNLSTCWHDLGCLNDNLLLPMLAIPAGKKWP